MLRATTTTTALALLALAAPGARAGLSVQIKNLCTFEIDLFDNSAVSPLAPGGDTSRTLSSGYVGMFRHGTSDQATLAEISLDAGSGRPWYDISTIPPGPGSCGSYQACKAATGKVGFNVAMQITPLTNVGSGTCTVLTCMNDGCSDAYLYPADDTKTHNCPAGTNFLVTFCPGGSGGATPAPTPSLTPSPTPTPTPTPSPTPEPTTPAPTTPEPTTTAPPTSEPPATNSSSSAKDENGPAAVNEEAVVGFASDLLASSKADSTTAAPATTTDAPVINTAPASGKDQGTVEANTQSSGGSGGGTGLVVAVVVGGVAMVAAAAIVAIRKKKMALEQLEQKTPMATPVRDRDNSLAAYQTTEVSVL